MYYAGKNTSYQIGLALSKFNQNGNITSSIIDIPNKNYYDTLFINKTKTLGDYLKVSILDEQTNGTIYNFVNLTENIIDISEISPFKHH